MKNQPFHLDSLLQICRSLGDVEKGCEEKKKEKPNLGSYRPVSTCSDIPTGRHCPICWKWVKGDLRQHQDNSAFCLEWQRKSSESRCPL